jgi:putative spermidine/putrescine transport system permease protein
MSAGRLLLGAHVVLVLLFLMGPLLVAVAVAFNAGERIEFPPQGLSTRWFAEAAGNELFRTAILRSAAIAALAALLSAVAGTAAALALHRGRLPGRSFAQGFVMLPLALPGIVLGLAQLPAMVGLGLRPGFAATVLGHAVIGVPYCTHLVLASLTHYDRDWDRASSALGAGPIRTLLEVTLPNVAPGVAAGAICTFLLSFDNVSLSLFLARGDTLPLRLMQAIQFNATPVVAAVSVFLVFVSALAVALLSRALRGRGAVRLAG